VLYTLKVDEEDVTRSSNSSSSFFFKHENIFTRLRIINNIITIHGKRSNFLLLLIRYGMVWYGMVWCSVMISNKEKEKNLFRSFGHQDLISVLSVFSHTG
jgi:hypothetical protein